MSMTEELDINVMRCFLESVILYPVGTDVALSNGETPASWKISPMPFCARRSWDLPPDECTTSPMM